MTVLDELLAFVGERRAQAYLVGGFVRDMLLERPRYDIDVTVTGSAAALARAFADAIGGTFFVLDAEYDVARVIVGPDGERYYVDFALVRGDTIEQDLATRDFTINAMGLDISQGTLAASTLIDPFNGQDDLQARRVCAVSSSVFLNDPVRLLRALRFEATLGFALDPETESWVRRDACNLLDASLERVRDEFFKIISADNVVRNLHRLDDLGLLEHVCPEVTLLKSVTQSPPHVYDAFEHTLLAVGALEIAQRSEFMNLAEGALADHLVLHFAEDVSDERQRGMLLRLALLLHDVGKATARNVEESGRIRFFGHEDKSAEAAEKALRRLRFSNEEIALVTTIVAQHMRPIWLSTDSGFTDRAIHRYFRATGDAGVDIAVHAWCDQHATYGETNSFESEAAIQAIIARLLDRYYHAHENIVDPTLFLNGRDVMETLNIGPGPCVGDYLDALREAQAVGEVATREQAVDFLKHRQTEGVLDALDCD